MKRRFSVGWDVSASQLRTDPVWLAGQALELGLIDQIGDVEDALDVAASLAGVPAKGAPVRLRRPFFSRLVDRFAARIAMSIADEVELRAWDRLQYAIHNADCSDRLTNDGPPAAPLSNHAA